ncbi:MAG: hypothetical protein RRC34_08550 [Lentisphaeria bacterium]|nr:hypothetical protein [Lentisphaeria bacterium]
MKKVMAKWKSISGRRRLLVAVAVLLIALVAAKYVPKTAFTLPLPRTIAAARGETQDLEKTLAKTRRRADRHARERQAVREQAGSLVWDMRGANPSTEVQAALERVARTANVTIRTMGRPRTDDVSETIRGMELSLNMTGTMGEIGRFLVAVRNFPRPFTWTACSIRPTNPTEASSVTLAGSVTAYYLTSAAETAVFESREATP